MTKGDHVKPDLLELNLLNSIKAPRRIRPVVVKMRRRKQSYAKSDNLILPEAFLARVEAAYIGGSSPSPTDARSYGTFQPGENAHRDDHSGD
jgi:hypothetical protein